MLYEELPWSGLRHAILPSSCISRFYRLFCSTIWLQPQLLSMERPDSLELQSDPGVTQLLSPTPLAKPAENAELVTPAESLHALTSGSSVPPAESLTFAAKAKMVWMSLSLWGFVAIYAVLYSLYVAEALIDPNPRLGKLLLKAPQTNVLISVMSQIFVTLLGAVFKDAFDSLRWHLAASETGSALSTFFELGAATSWLAVILMAIFSLKSSLGGVIRYCSLTGP